MTYPVYIRQKILADLETDTYREVASLQNLSQHTGNMEKTEQPAPKPKIKYQDKARYIRDHRCRPAYPLLSMFKAINVKPLK